MVRTLNKQTQYFRSMKQYHLMAWLKACLWALVASIATSCSKGKDALALEEDYITLIINIGTNVEKDDDLRSVFMSERDGRPYFQFANLDNSGTTGTRPVYAMITKKGSGTPGTDNEREIIWESKEPMQWTITNDGRRLTYKGELKILKGKLTNAEDLQIHAVTGVNKDTDTGQLAYRRNLILPPNTWYQLKSTRLVFNGQKNSEVLNIPYTMNAKIKVEKMKVSLVDGEEPKFKPKDVLVTFKVKNNLNSNIVPMRFLADLKTVTTRAVIDLYGTVTEPTKFRHERDYSPYWSISDVEGEYDNRDILKSKQEAIYALWLDVEAAKEINEVYYEGVLQHAKATRVNPNNEIKQGSWVGYEVEFINQDLSLNHGAIHTDNHGNGLPMVTDNTYTFSVEDLKAYQKPTDAFKVYYYFPYVLRGLSGVPSVFDGKGVYDSSEEQYKIDITSDYFGFAYLKTDPVIFPGQTEPFFGTSDFYIVGDESLSNTIVIYAVRFKNSPKNRVFQRFIQRQYPSPFNTGLGADYWEVSFLPYVEADESKALTKAYWEQHESSIQKLHLDGINYWKVLSPSDGGADVIAGWTMAGYPYSYITPTPFSYTNQGDVTSQYTFLIDRTSLN